MMKLLNKEFISVGLLFICLFDSAILLTLFTKEQLAKYDGTNKDLPIYLAIKGIVFDVSKGAKFYGPGGSYHSLAGKDCTRAIAKWSNKEEDLNENISDLTEDELEKLEETLNKVYKSKYPIAGYMDYYHSVAEDL